MTGPVPADPPRSIDEAARRVLESLGRGQREELRAMEREDLADAHFGLGLAVRNELGLWRSDCPLTKPPPCDYRAPHPDAVSAAIVERVWEMLRREDGA